MEEISIGESEVMMSTAPLPSQPRWTAAQLRALPPAQRDAILAAAAAAADRDYRTDSALTDYEAFGKDDLYGDSADAQPR